MEQFYDFRVRDIDGREVSLGDYKGKVALVVNVASKCGFTPQYEGLQALYGRYKEKGLEVLAFPANDFLGQEPGADAEIKSFCTSTYHVTFPLFSKVSVKGKAMHPLYKYLTDKKLHPATGGRITWNFNKFLISRAGDIVSRFSSRDEPLSDSVIAAVEAAL